jgi:hypothetical protein
VKFAPSSYASIIGNGHGNVGKEGIVIQNISEGKCIKTGASLSKKVWVTELSVTAGKMA